MTEQLWGRRFAVMHLAPPPAMWTGEPTTAAELTGMRRQLRGVLTDGPRGRDGDGEDVERLLLAFEELASNGLRHGRQPVRAEVTADESGWLLDVSDAAIDEPPCPAVGRDAADGGLGLYLVARLSATHGWAINGDRKHVWAHIACSGPE